MTEIATIQPPRAIGPAPKAYAFERSLGIPPAEACRRAGGKVENGQATKWEANPRVKAWVGYYRSLGNDEAMLAAKRSRIEERLALAAFGNIFDFATTTEPTAPSDWGFHDKDRFYALPPETQKFILAQLMEMKGLRIDWERVLESPYGAIISGFKFDKDTGHLVDFERDNALQALSQLRDMHGFKAPARTEFAGPGGGAIPFADVTLADRVRALVALMSKTKAEKAEA